MVIIYYSVDHISIGSLSNVVDHILCTLYIVDNIHSVYNGLKRRQ